jgi:hypothetical protein
VQRPWWWPRRGPQRPPILTQLAPRTRTVLTTAGRLQAPDDRASPLRLLVAIALGDGVAAEILAGVRDLLPLAPALPPHRLQMTGTLTSQVIGSATNWVARSGVPVLPEHLLVVLIDQAHDDVLDALSAAGIDPSHAREAVLTALGLAVDEPPVPLQALPPAGTVDVPPLPLDALPQDLWLHLRERNDRPPLHQRWRVWEWDFRRALCSDEKYVFRLARRHQLNDDQLYSLLQHDRRAYVRYHYPSGEPRWTPRKDPGESFLPSGWACWFGNRRETIEDTWERLTRQP